VNTKGFRTLWKHRDNHQTCIIRNPHFNLKKLPKAEPAQPTAYKTGHPSFAQHESATHREVKEYIKAMKKGSDKPMGPNRIAIPRTHITIHSNSLAPSQ
jgi:hypothetical protein